MTVRIPPRLLILDCDGVLVRSEKANLAYYNRLFSLFALPEVRLDDRERMGLLHTLSTPQVIDRFFPDKMREEGKIAASGLEFSQFSGLLEEEEGWSGVLQGLKERGCAICVATNRGRSAADVLCAVGLAPWIERLFTICDVARPKPAPDLLLLALASFAARPEEALYVGDSGLDQAAARDAGVPFVGFRHPGDYRIDRPEELRALFE